MIRRPYLLCISLLTALCATATAQVTGQNGPPAQTPPRAETGNQKVQIPPTARPSFRPQSIYIDSPPDAQRIKIEIVKKLQKWGEIAVVSLPERADIILQLVQSGKLNAFTGSGDRGSVVLKNRRTGEDLWSQDRGGGWSMRGWSNAAVGRKLGDELI